MSRHPIDATLQQFATDVGTTDLVSVAGNRTRWALGGSLLTEQPVRVLSAPQGVVSYEPEEMTVRVRAGTTVADLSAALAEQRQRCALPHRRGTVGGAVAVGQHHVELLGRGALRNSVLEVRYVSSDGKVIVGGGPTVKNVTGFDLPRLLTGSLGTLGLIGEVVLRTNPIPTVRQWVKSSDGDPFAARAAILRPGAILWDGANTWVLLEGNTDEIREMQQSLQSIGTFESCDESDVPNPESSNGLCRWSLAPSQLRSAPSFAGTAPFIASVGTGMLWTTDPQPERPGDRDAQAVAARIKFEFDPTGRLNPGRNPAQQGPGSAA